MIATGPGILCPACGHHDSDVIDSRPCSGYIRRRRRCKSCVPAMRFTTVEVAALGGDTGVAIIGLALKFQSELESLPSHEQSIIRSMLAALLVKRGQKTEEQNDAATNP